MVILKILIGVYDLNLGLDLFLFFFNSLIKNDLKNKFKISKIAKVFGFYYIFLVLSILT